MDGLAAHSEAALRCATPLAGPNIGINRAGWVVGSVETQDGDRAFIYRDGSFEILGTLGGSYSDAYAINDAGQVAGSAMRADGKQRAFLHEGGVMRDLGALTADGHSAGAAINESGDVVGNSYGARHGKVRTPRLLTPLRE